jgi:hypothetical protein
MKTNLISQDGLRYEDKASATPFFGGTTISCVKCGIHKLRKFGSFQHKFGGRLFFCFECKPKKIMPI